VHAPGYYYFNMCKPYERKYDWILQDMVWDRSWWFQTMYLDPTYLQLDDGYLEDEDCDKDLCEDDVVIER